MLLLSFLSNISLSLALVANRASLPSRLGVSTTPVHHQRSATQQQQQFAPSSSSSSRHLHPFTRDNCHSSNNSKHASNRRLNALGDSYIIIVIIIISCAIHHHRQTTDHPGNHHPHLHRPYISIDLPEIFHSVPIEFGWMRHALRFHVIVGRC